MGEVLKKQHLHQTLPLTLQLRTMKGGVVTKLRLIVFLPSILVLWEDNGTLAGSVPQTHDSSQFPKFLVLDKPGGKKSFIEIEGKNERKESVQKETVRHQIESRDSKKAKGTCSDVTFGECPIREEEIIANDTDLPSARHCQALCELTRTCDYYRFNYQTKECKLITASYKILCKIIAAPKEIRAFRCLISPQRCDAFIEEDCEYSGNDVKTEILPPVGGHEFCQASCKENPNCKYWIYNKAEMTCIHKGEGSRICSVSGGQKYTPYDYCSYQKIKKGENNSENSHVK